MKNDSPQKTPLSSDELLQEFEEQVQRLIFLCESYDQGTIFLFKDIAVSLRVLLHDGKGNTKALLPRIISFESLKLVNSAEKYSPANRATSCLLLNISVSDAGFKYIPKCNVYKSYINFDTW